MKLQPTPAAEPESRLGIPSDSLSFFASHSARWARTQKAGSSRRVRCSQPFTSNLSMSDDENEASNQRRREPARRFAVAPRRVVFFARALVLRAVRRPGARRALLLRPAPPRRAILVRHTSPDLSMK